MTASKFYSKYVCTAQGSTTATQPITEHSKRNATSDAGIDWHADRKTEQE
jgi:hypothetical protein